jgi:hypothetical protein
MSSPEPLLNWPTRLGQDEPLIPTAGTATAGAVGCIANPYPEYPSLKIVKYY